MQLQSGNNGEMNPQRRCPVDPKATKEQGGGCVTDNSIPDRAGAQLIVKASSDRGETNKLMLHLGQVEKVPPAYAQPQARWS
jgi:hypothetical protein